MKRILALSIALSLAVTVSAQTFSDDFESYTVGAYIGQASPVWTTWSGVTGSTSLDDVQVVNTDAFSGTRSLYLFSTTTGGPQDIVLPFGSLLNSGQFILKTMFKIPVGKSAYFNFQGNVNPGITWTVESRWNTNGTFYFNNGPNNIIFTDSFPAGSWFELKMDINLSNNVWKVYIDNKYLGSFANATTNIASLNLYPADANASFWVDDVSFIIAPLVPNDAGLATINSPVVTCLSNNVAVTLQNFGTSTLTSSVINWSVNNVVQTPFNWSGSIAPISGTNGPIIIGNYNFNTGDVLKVWTSNPNNVADGNPHNDTLSVTITNTFAAPPQAPVTTSLEACGAQTFTINASASSPQDTIIWYTTQTGNTFANKGTSYTTPIVQVNDSLEYWLGSRNANNCESERTRVSVKSLADINSVEIIPSATFQGIFNHGGLPGLDFACVGDTLEYEIAPQTNLPNTDYGTTWEIINYSLKTSDGVSPVNTSNSLPSASSNGLIKVIPDVTEADSVFLLYLEFENLVSGCKKIISRVINVAPVPQPSFTATAVCVGSSMSFTNSSVMPGSGTMSYNWNFGNNSTSTLVNPTHLYAAAGNYNVTLVAQSSQGCNAQVTQQVTVFDLPVANFSVNGKCANEHIAFNNQSVIHSGPSSYHWRFGKDNDVSTTENPTYMYGAQGQFTVTMIVENNGCKDTTTKLINVEAAPVADFITTPTCLNNTVDFINATAFPPGQINYTWTIDGNTVTSESPTYKYNTPGKHAVTLIANYQNGCSDMVTDSVTVLEIPGAGYSYTHVMGGIYEFNANETGHKTYFWDFKDGNFSTTTTTATSNTYKVNGTYDVSLMVTHNNGCIDSTVQSINVMSVSINEPKVLSGELKAFPNPFVGETNIQYNLISAAEVKLSVYDLTGRLVANLVDGQQLPGEYNEKFSAEAQGFGPGLYLVRLVVNGQSFMKRIIEIQ